MAGELALDTNIVAALMNQEPKASASAQGAGVLLLPVIVLGELYFGAANSARPLENAQRVDTYTAEMRLLVCDEATARQYGDVKRQLRAKGKPIPENDIWIATLALQHDLTLVTRDAHFAQVDGLRTVAW